MSLKPAVEVPGLSNLAAQRGAIKLLVAYLQDYASNAGNRSLLESTNVDLSYVLLQRAVYSLLTNTLKPSNILHLRTECHCHSFEPPPPAIPSSSLPT